MSVGGLRSAAANAALAQAGSEGARVRVQGGGLVSAAAHAQISREHVAREARQAALKGFHAICVAWVRLEHAGARLRNPVAFRAAEDIRAAWNDAWRAG